MKQLKENYISIIIGCILTILGGVFAVNKVGIKDGVMFALAIMITFFIIILSRKDVKKAISLFIISMPILVTARKILYIDFFVLKLNFESLIILYLFIFKFKSIKQKLSNLIESNRYIKLLISLTIIFVISSYLSVFFSENLMDTLMLTTTSVLIPTLLLVIIIGIFEREDIKKIVYSLIISINLSCLYGAVQVLGIGLDLSVIKRSREYLTFGYHNVNIFVNVALMVYPLLLNQLLYKKNTKKENLFLVGSLLLQTGAIFITFSRGAWLSLAMVVVAIFFSKRYKVIFIAMVLIGLIVGKSLLPTILNRGGSNGSFLSNTSNTARILSIYTSKAIMKENIFGVGIGNFNSNYRNDVIKGYLSIEQSERALMSVPLYTLEHPHNFFLYIGTELGVVSLIIMLLILYNIIKCCIKSFSDNRGILIAIGLFIFIGLTTGIELNHKGVLTNTYLLWILFGICSLQQNTCKDNLK